MTEAPRTGRRPRFGPRAPQLSLPPSGVPRPRGAAKPGTTLINGEPDVVTTLPHLHVAPEAPVGRPPYFSADSVRLGPISLQVTSLEATASWLLDTRRPDGAQPVRLVNAYSVALADDDPGYRAVLCGDGLNLPDGSPVLWFMRWTSRRRFSTRPQRVRGPSLFERTLQLSEGRDVRHFFLGGSTDTLFRLLHEVHTRFPGCHVAGSHSPPFGDVTDEQLDAWAERIRRSGTDVVWIGLGTPKQDHVAVELTRRLGVHCVGVGAAFDFLARTQPEAPRLLQDAGLEWLFRLATEPRRLWRRYLIGNVRFLRVATRAYIRTWTSAR